MKIDVHSHILPESWPDLKERYGYGGWVQLRANCDGSADMTKDDKFFRKVEANCWSAEKRLEEMDRTGVNVQVLSTVPVMFSYWAKPEDTLDLCRLLNEDLARTVRANPRRFQGLGTVPLQAPDLAVQELRRCVTELGLRGVQIGSHVEQWNLDAPELLPFFKVHYLACEELGAAVFVHPWDMETGGRYSKYWLPWLVGMPAETTQAICCMTMGGVLDKCPDLRVCFAHGGGAFPFTVGRVEHGYNVRPDLCATESPNNPRSFLGRFYTDSLVHDERALQLLVDVIGQDHVMLGSDYPFPLGEQHPGHLVVTSSLSEDTKEKLLWKNALQFLGLREENLA